jgi:uncharacterized membrane protein
LIYATAIGFCTLWRIERKRTLLNSYEWGTFFEQGFYKGHKNSGVGKLIACCVAGGDNEIT